jgi:hypothetical protein
MKWVLTVFWIYGSSSGVDITTWDTLDRCFNIGEGTTDDLKRVGGDNMTAAFTCRDLK